MPDRATKVRLSIIIAAAIAVITGPAIARALVAILENPAWFGSDVYAVVKDLQSLIGGLFTGIAALVGIWLGFWGHRLRDKRLRGQEARALALALYGELTAALISCAAFVSQIEAIKTPFPGYDLSEQIMGSNYGPRVSTKVFDANADKLGLLSETLVGGMEVQEQLLAETIQTFDRLSDIARIAQKVEPTTLGELHIERQRSASLLKANIIPEIEETMGLFQAYARGGFPEATKAAQGVMANRAKRLKRLGKELGIDPETNSDDEPES